MSVKKDTQRGTWFYVIDVATVDGKRQQLRRRGFATKKAAEAAEAEVVADHARGAFVRPSRVTLASFLLGEWMPAKVGALRASTANSYDRMIRLYVEPAI